VQYASTNYDLAPVRLPPAISSLEQLGRTVGSWSNRAREWSDRQFGRRSEEHDPSLPAAVEMRSAAVEAQRAAAQPVAAALKTSVDRWLSTLQAPLERVGLTAETIVEFHAGERCSFWFVRADQLRDLTGTTPLRLQELRRDHPDWLAQRTLSFDEGCTGAYVQDTLVVSHRWEEPGKPDPLGVQFATIKAYLSEHDEIKWVWFDYWSMPQGKDKTEWEDIEFSIMLPNINLLYLFCSVLILADLSYVSRFWTQFEAFLSMRKVSTRGLEATPEAERRCVIKCIHNAPDGFKGILTDMWAHKTADEACDILAKPDVTVTNQKDKDQQLPKLKELNAFAKRVMGSVDA